MNTAQQTALETLVGRALTTEEISAIDPLLAYRNDGAIAALLSQGRTKTVQHMIGERGVIDKLGPVAGDAFLAALESIQAVGDLPAPMQPCFGAIKRGVAWFKTDAGLDVGSATLRGLLDALVSAGKMDATSVATIKALAVESDPLSTYSVSVALNAAGA